jgi:hypothetical protein
VDFRVRVVGPVVPVSSDDDATLETYLARHRSRLLGALPRPKPVPRRRDSDPTAPVALEDLYARLDSTRLLQAAALK